MNKPLVLLLVASLLAGIAGGAQAQEPEGASDPIPLPFTRDALKVMYKKGLSLHYTRITYSKGKRPVVHFVFQDVIDSGSKAYLLRTLTFNAKGVAIGKPEKPKPLAYRADSKAFRSADAYEYERIKVSGQEYSAHKFAYKVDLGGRPGWRTVWYSAKHRGLLLKTMIRPIGDFGKKDYMTLEIMEVPARLSGKKQKVGAPQGNLPWRDQSIIDAWPAGSWVEFVVKNKKETLKLKRTMIAREPSCYMVREQLWGAEGKPRRDSVRPRMWVTWLNEVRIAPPRFLKKLLDRDVEAAGRVWPCKVFSLKEDSQTRTWFLSKEVAGLTVRFVSVRGRLKTERDLSAFQLPLAEGGK